MTNEFIEKFGHLLVNEDKQITISDVVGVEGRRYAIKKLKKEIEQLKDNQKQFAAHFKKKEESAEYVIRLLEQQIMDYLLINKLKKISLPEGTVYIAKTTHTEWPNEETLIQFSKKNQIPIKTTVAAIKSKIKEYIKQTGTIPEGFGYTEGAALRIRNTPIEDQVISNNTNEKVNIWD